MKYTIEITNTLDGYSKIIDWHEDEQNYLLFIFTKGHMKCDCNRYFHLYGHNSIYPCNTNDYDRIFAVTIRDELESVIYQDKGGFKNASRYQS